MNPTNPSADTIQASSGGATSFALTALWVSPSNIITTTPVTGQFFTTTSCPSGCEAFNTPLGTVPTFSQTFPDLMFNPPGAVPAVRSFADQVLDFNAAPAGAIIAQGNGHTAGEGDMAGFSAVFRGSFVVTQAGTYTLNVTSRDGFLFGMSNGATRVSGININPPASGTTPFALYPIIAANNGPSNGTAAPIVVTFPAPGSYPYEFDYRSGTGGPLTFTVTLTQGSTTLGVRPIESPILTSNTASPIVGQAASFTVKATDETGAPIVGLPVNVSVTGLVSQPLAGLTNASGQTTVTYTENTPFTDTLQASALVNGLQLFSGQNTVVWGPPATSPNAPKISVEGEKQLRLPSTGSYTATVTDPQAPNGGAITVAWKQTGGPAAVQIASPTSLTTTVTFPIPGVYTLQITATDSFGPNTLSVGPINVLAQDTRSLPQGWLSGLDSLVTGVVPITLIPGETLTSGTLLLYPVNNTSGIVELDPAKAVTLNSNTTGTGTLATVDTTLLADGPYYILLQATDTTGKTMSSGMPFVVGGDYKPGRVTTTVTDLVVPAPGLPIQISRTYDSLVRSTSSDFGYGWTLGVNVQLSVSATNDVTITINGQRRTFYFTPYLVGYQLPDGTFAPNLLGVNFSAYTPEPGMYGTLTVGNNGSNLVGSNTGCLFDWIVKAADGTPFCYNNVGTYSPGSYVYTDPYGRTYSINRDGGLSSITDLAGNTLTVTPAGITGSNHLIVPFQRDAQGRIIKITDPLGKDYNYTYDGTGNLATVTYPEVTLPAQYTYDGTHLYTGGTDPRGNALPSTTYFTDGKLKTSTIKPDAATNYTTSYVYGTTPVTVTYPDNSTAAGLQTTLTNPDNATVAMVYDAYGKLISSTDPLNHTTRNRYDANHNLTATTDPLGHTTRYTYDSSGNRTSITRPTTSSTANATNSTLYNAFGQPVQTTDELGNTQILTYDSHHSPAKVTDNLNGTPSVLASYVYNADGTRQASALGYDILVSPGKATRYTYDSYGNLATTTDPLGRQTTYARDNMGRLATVVPPLPTPLTPSSAVATSYEHDVLGRTTRIVRPLGVSVTYTYDGNSNRLSETEANGRVTSNQYDFLNRLISTTYSTAPPTTKRYTYNSRNQVVDTTDEALNVVHNDYDLAGRLTAVTKGFGSADASTTTYTYWDDGRKKTERDARGNTTTFYYDEAGRNIRTVDALAGTTQYSYDDAGRRVSVTDPGGNVTRFAYDARGRQTTITYPDGTNTRRTYDTVGRLLTQVDQAGKSTSYVYDDTGRMTTLVQMDHPDQNHNAISYTYDSSGNTVAITDQNGHTTSSSFDFMNRLTSRTLPSGGSPQSYTYDASSNILSETDFNGNTTRFDYDVMGRLLAKRPDPRSLEADVRFTYTSTGKTATMIDASGTTSYAYDALDRLTSKATPQGTLTYAYDAAGNLASTSSSNLNGISVTYSYDEMNRLQSVVDHRFPVGHNTTVYAYDAAGRMSTITYPNGVVSSYNYDSQSRLTSLPISKTGPLAAYNYVRGPAGTWDSATELNGRTVDWNYDSVYRLVNETVRLDPASKNGSVSFVLDSGINRLSQTSTLSSTSSGTFSYDANDRIASATYDSNGNTLVQGSKTLSYDFENHPVSVNNGQVRLVYDGSGTRVAKIVGSTTTRYLVDDLSPTGYAQVVDELTDGVVQRIYTYGKSRISQNQFVGGTWTPSFYGYDGFGTVRLLTDAAGAITDTYDYDAWGGLIRSTGTTPNANLYRGEPYDSDLGLYYLRARWYDPSSGRFLTADPLEYSAKTLLDINPYAYALANPVANSDPSGQGGNFLSRAMWMSFLAETAAVMEKVGEEAAAKLSLELYSAPRALYLQNLILDKFGRFAFYKNVVAVCQVANRGGKVVTMVAIRARPAVVEYIKPYLTEGEQLIVGWGDAEVQLINEAVKYEIRYSINAGQPMCPNCLANAEATFMEWGPKILP